MINVGNIPTQILKNYESLRGLQHYTMCTSALLSALYTVLEPLYRLQRTHRSCITALYSALQSLFYVYSTTCTMYSCCVIPLKPGKFRQQTKCVLL